MKIFISWSGQQGKLIAFELNHWLKTNFHFVETFFSEENTNKGKPWVNSLRKELEEIDIGIFILTHDGVNSSWLSFEAGALSKRTSTSKILPILFGIDTDLLQNHPLSCFQFIDFNKKNILSLLYDLRENSQVKIKKERITETFFKRWCELEKSVNKIIVEYEKESRQNDSIIYKFDSDYATNEASIKNLYRKIIEKRTGNIASFSEAKINIIDYNEKNNFYVIETNIKSMLKNMYKEKSIHDELTVKVTPDKVESYSNNRPIGEIKSLKVLSENKSQTIIERIPILDNFSKEVPFEIPPNGELEYQLSFWIINKSNDKYFTFFQRLSESAKVIITNKIENMSIIIKSQANITIIEPHRSLEIYNGVIFPENTVDFFIHDPIKLSEN